MEMLREGQEELKNFCLYSTQELICALALAMVLYAMYYCRLLYKSHCLWPFFLSLTIIHVLFLCRGVEDVSHSRVCWDGKQFCFGHSTFPDVETLMEHFDQQPLLRLIAGDIGVHIDMKQWSLAYIC